MRGDQVSAERPGLKRREPRRGTLKRDVGCGLALKHLAHKDQTAIFAAVADAIADHAAMERCGELGSEVAHLVGMREKNQVGLRRGKDWSQRWRRAVGRVGVQQVVL